MSRPFKVLLIGREHVLVFQLKEHEDKMVLVDRIDEDLIHPHDLEGAVVSIHHRCDVLNRIFRQWGPGQKGCDDLTVPSAAVPFHGGEEGSK